MNLGLALSGGGFRATAYHLGLLARLAEENRLEDVTHLSTVSGGSLCVGLVYALNGFRWPTSQAYREQVVAQARRHMTGYSFQSGLLWGVLRTPWRFFGTKASILSLILQQQWGVNIKLNELPAHPRWMINATCYETGKNWRFERFRMGDYVFGYTADTNIPLSDALAASAGFPGLIGPLVLTTSEHRWFTYAEQADQPASSMMEFAAEPSYALAPEQALRTQPVDPAYKSVHLWDGGVYDNHGLEGLHDFATGWRQGIEFLIVSDGSGKAHPAQYRWGAGVFLRIITGVMMDQIRSLRTRAILERIKHHGDPGVFLAIGNDCRNVLIAAGKAQQLSSVCDDCQSEEEAQVAGNFPTVIRRLTDEEFELLYRNGWEVANCALHAYYPHLFGHVEYRRDAPQ